MNIGKYIRFFRRNKQLNWHRGQLLSHHLVAANKRGWDTPTTGT
jgi:hypothetical protein